MRQGAWEKIVEKIMDQIDEKIMSEETKQEPVANFELTPAELRTVLADQRNWIRYLETKATHGAEYIIDEARRVAPSARVWKEILLKHLGFVEERLAKGEP